MREIKFRYWDGRSTYISETLAPGNELFVEPDVQAIMQYTGLKDKNGKEIYEGDLIKGLRDAELDYSTQITQVEFKRGAFVESYFGEPISKYTSSYHYGNTLEVIGNIYENPKLLEEA